jgi:hypothetical protein
MVITVITKKYLELYGTRIEPKNFFRLYRAFVFANLAKITTLFLRRFNVFLSRKCLQIFFFAKMLDFFSFFFPSAITFALIMNSVEKEFCESFRKYFCEEINECLRSLLQKREKHKFCEKAKSSIKLI